MSAGQFIDAAHAASLELDEPPNLKNAKKELDKAIKHGERISPWGVVDIPLLATPGRVVEWLTDNRVNVLILDQKLNESAANSVTYSGHEVIQEVRRRLPDMPVYMLTAFSDSPDVESNLSAMEELVPRGDLGRKAAVLVARMR